MKEKTKLALAVLSQTIPGEETMNTHFLYVQEEEIAIVKRALMYCVLQSEKVHILSSSNEELEIHVYIEQAVIQNPHFLELLEHIIDNEQLHARAHEYLFSYFVQCLHISNITLEHDDILQYFAMYIEFLQAVVFITGFADREDLLEGLVNIFTEEEQIEFDILIEAINDMQNMYYY